MTRPAQRIGLGMTLRRDKAQEAVERPSWMCRLGITCEKPGSPRVNGVCTGCAQPDLTPAELAALVEWHRRQVEFCMHQDYHAGSVRHEQRARELERYLPASRPAQREEGERG